MLRLLLNWLINALALMLVAYIVPGVHVAGLGSALIAALVIGLVNATLGLVLKIITFPLTIVTFGLFLLVINALMLMLASALLDGFEVSGFLSALLGAVLLALVGMVMRKLLLPRRGES